MTGHSDTEGCRYIVGELKSANPWHYCGEMLRQGSSYCDEHHAICYYRRSRRVHVEKNMVTAAYFTMIDDAA